MSIKKLSDLDIKTQSGPIYTIDIKGNYGFEKFLKNGGASNDKELISYMTNNITKGLVPLSFEQPKIACTSFTAVTDSEERIHARNYDLNFTSGLIVTTKADPTIGRLATISSVDLQCLGISPKKGLNSISKKILTLAAPYLPVDGMNSAGVSCAVHMSCQGFPTQQCDKDKVNLTTTTMIRLILDYAKTVDEAIQLVSKYNMHDSANTTFHFIVADKTGRSAILEWISENNAKDTFFSERKLNVIYNKVGENVEGRKINHFQHMTNFIVADGYYENDSLKKGLDRYNKVAEMINPDGKNFIGLMSKDRAIEILKTVGRRTWTNNHKCVTVWSCIYNLTKQDVIWISNEQFNNPEKTFHFGLKKNKFVLLPR